MSYKIHVTLGEFSSAFKAKRNPTSGTFDTFSQKKEFHNIELTGDKKFNISESDIVYDIVEFSDLVSCPKIIVKNTANVKTNYPAKERVFPNPQNKEYKLLTILNPIFKDITIMSHLACADDKNNQFNLEQKKYFDQIKKEFPECKYSLAASGGIFLGKQYCWRKKVPYR